MPSLQTNKATLKKAESDLRSVKSSISRVQRNIVAEKKKIISSKSKLSSYSRQLNTYNAKKRRLDSKIALLKKTIATQEKAQKTPSSSATFTATSAPTSAAFTPSSSGSSSSGITTTPIATATAGPINIHPSVIAAIPTSIADPNAAYKNAALKMVDHYPVVFLPIRLETRFIKNELLIRVFPDEIFVKSHEPELTVTELDSAKIFWEALYEIDKSTRSEEEKDQEKRNIANQVLVELGKERAAWAVKVTQPSTLKSDDLFSEKQLFRGSLPTIKAPTKSGEDADQSWTRAAYTDVLPERFSFNLYDSKGELEINKFGNKIDSKIQMGYDPKIDRVGSHNYQPGNKWLLDFNEAIKKGLGIRIKITSKQWSAGFSKLTVFGVKSNKTVAASKLLLKDLFENHQFKVNGMGLVDIGTPTKNVELQELEAPAEKELDVFINNHLRGTSALTSSELSSDGEVLASAIGLPLEDLAHVENMGKKDLAHSQEMGKVLWSSTMGYYLDQFALNSYTKVRDAQAKEFYLDHVSGRGTIPSIRVDDQVYGISPMSDFSKWKGSSSAPKTGDGIFDTILSPLYDHIFKPLGDAKNTSGSDYEKLSLQASSKTFSARTILGKEVVKGLVETMQKKLSVTTIQAALRRIGLELDHIPDVINYGLDSGSTVLTGPIIDSGKTFAGRTLQSSSLHNKNFIHLLFDASSFTDVINHRFQGKVMVQEQDSLLYLYVRYAYLREAVKSSLNYLEPKKLANAIAIMDTEFVNLRATNQLSKDMEDYLQLKQERIVKEEPKFQTFVKGLQPTQSFTALSAFSSPASSLSGLSSTNKKKATDYVAKEVTKKMTTESRVNVTASKWDYLNKPFSSVSGKLPMGDFLFKQMAQKKTETKELTAMREALGNLKDVNAQELENLFTEHIDLSSHRIDAWLMGVVNERLAENRKISKYSEGSYIGAYGFVENLKRGKGSGNPENGFIHAPSRDQAKSSAILRSSFKEIAESMSNSGDTNVSIDISSHRMKKALELIEGINKGQDLGALLGFMIEHLLAEKGMGEYILTFRNTYGTVSSLKDEEDPAYNAYATVDGKKVIQDYQSGTSVTSKLRITASHRAKVDEVLEAADNILDGLSDLLHVEGIYQIVKGNYSGLSAILKSLNNFDSIPEIDFLRTQTHGIRHENRVLMLFSESGNENVWWRPTYKSKLNPWVNEWLGTLLPNPANIYIHASAEITTADNVVLINENIPWNELFSGEPIDFCSHLPADNVIKLDFIEKLVKLHLAKRHPEATSMEEFEINIKSLENLTSSDYSLFEVDFIVQKANAILQEGRSLNHDDLIADAEELEVDKSEQMQRASLIASLESVLAMATSNVDNLIVKSNQLGTTFNTANREFYVQLSEMIVHQSIQLNLMGMPDFGPLYKEETHQAILNFVRGYESRFNSLVEEINAAKENAIKLQDVQKLLSKVTIQGEYVTLPFDLSSETQLYQSFTEQEFSNIKGTPQIHDWLYTASKVKPNLNDLMLMDQVTDSNNVFNHLEIKQIPYDSGVANEWMAGDFSPIDQEDMANSNTSFVFLSNAKKINIKKRLSGVVIADWDEIIPFRKIDTGVAFNYDAPNAKSPKNILLAVSPDANGKWDWEDLLGVINESLNMAKVRTVTQKDLSDTDMKYFLPATVAPIYDDESNPGLDFLKNNKNG